MSDDDVHPDEMAGTHDFDDDAMDALLSGSGGDINADLANVVGDVRSAFISTGPEPGPELAALIGATWQPATPGKRSRRTRTPVAVRRLIVATVAIFGATSMLAVANALPAPMQDAMSSIGIGESAHNDNVHVTADGVDDTTTTTGDSNVTSTTGVDNASTTAPDNTATTVPGAGGDKNGHGKDVSAVAGDKSLKGCEHGRAVSAVASGKVKDKPCPHSTTTTTVAGVAPPTTVADDDDAPGNSGSHGHDGTKPKDDGNNNGNGRPTGKDKHADDADD